jgi:putative tricarboxylic transport membrane protein
MGTFSMLLDGFAHALTPMTLLMALVGVLIGSLAGMMPGIGPTPAIAILMPFTTVLGPVQGIVMLAAIYYGAIYGGSTTAILLNIPAELQAVPVTLDGYPLAKQGRGGPALGIAAISSFVAGVMGVLGLIFFAPLLAQQALKFGPPEYFALMILTLTVIVNLSGVSVIKGLVMGLAGYLVSMVGVGPSSGHARFTFGIPSLSAGIEMVSVIIGLFAISEVISGLGSRAPVTAAVKLGRVYPTKADLKLTAPTMVRSGLIGFFLGLLPGASPAVSAFIAYDAEKRISKTPEIFGKGALQGVAAPEAAGNATASSGFIPLFTLGIPSSPPLAILLAGLMIYGLQPGPDLFKNSGSFVWAVIASMFIGNVMLVVLHLPLVGIWVKLTQIPLRVLKPVVLILCVVGVYTVRNSMFDILVALIFGVIGYFLRKYHWPLVPFILCFMLGPLTELSFVQSMSISNGSLTIFLTNPIALVILIIAASLFAVSAFLMRRSRRRSLLSEAILSDQPITTSQNK